MGEFAESNGHRTPVQQIASRHEWLTELERRPASAVLAIAVALYALILMLKVSAPDPGDGVLLLLVVPIALLAMRFGTLGGAAASLVAILLLALSQALGAPDPGALGYLTRAVTFLMLGLMLGSFAEQLRSSRAEMEGRVARGLTEANAANLALRLEVDARAEAERTLASEGDFLAAVLDSLDTGIVACDADGVLTLFNQATRRIHGLPERSLPAAEWAEHYDLFCPDGKTPMETQEIPLHRAFAGERVRDVRMVVAPKGKEPRTFRAAGQPIIDKTGHKHGAVVAMHDITDRLRAETQLQLAIEEAVTRLARAVEYRDIETGDHVGRMSRYARVIAEAAGVDPERCAMIEVASRMHDVGKLGVPDRVLLKPGKLNLAEWELMQRHTLTGHVLLAGSGNELLELAATIALTHHERVDGTGYPRGLAGDGIPLEGRIVALADVFDALTSDRVYRPRFSLEKALSIMAEGCGSQFDAELFEVFTEALPRLVATGGDNWIATDTGAGTGPPTTLAADRMSVVLGAMADTVGEESHSIVDWVCRAAVSLLSLKGAGLSLMVDGELCGTAGVPDPGIAAVQELQLTLGEGPCADAWSGGWPVLEPDLAVPAVVRWPVFAQAGVDAGVRAVFAFPLHLGAIRIGVLVLYRDRPGALSADELAYGLVLADVATQVVLDLQAGAPVDALHELLAKEPPHWAEIHQATGMVSLQLGVPLDEAFVRLRAHAFAEGRPLRAVGSDVVAGRLRLEDSA